ncbi:MAG: CapA family protein [Candidatus Brennerbacteria bacterium]
MAKRLALLIFIAAGLEITVAVFLGIIAYRVESAMHQGILASFRTNLIINTIAARAAELARPKTATLLFTGDIMLARGVAFYTEREGGNDYKFPFLRTLTTLRAADLTVGNLEHPVSDRGKNQGSEYSLRASPASLEGLADAGFDIVSLANNHMWDWGTDALSDTFLYLDRAGIRHIGAGMNETDANRPLVVEVKGNSIAFVSWTNLYPEGLEAKGDGPGISRFREDEAVTQVRFLAGGNDIVVALLHFGDEYQTKANEAQRRIARALVDAGADLVAGHHPHVAQEVEQYKDGWIAYSLGNFVFDQGFSDETMRGLTLRVTVKGGRVESVEQIPTHMNAYFQPAFEAVQ